MSTSTRAPSLLEKLEQAVYEVSTAKPLTPKNRSYNTREWEVYNEGYYQAVVAAMRALKAAFSLWEGRTMTGQVLGMRPGAAPANATEQESAWPVGRAVRTALIVAAAIATVFALEIVVLLGVMIYNAID